MKVASNDGEAMKAAIKWIKSIASDPEVGQIYEGTVVKVMEFGAFVNFFGAKDGLVHISQLAANRVQKTSDVVKEGDKVKVKLLGFDDRGKTRLSMKAVDQETGEDLEAKQKTEPGRRAKPPASKPRCRCERQRAAFQPPFFCARLCIAASHRAMPPSVRMPMSKPSTDFVSRLAEPLPRDYHSSTGSSSHPRRNSCLHFRAVISSARPPASPLSRTPRPRVVFGPDRRRRQPRPLHRPVRGAAAGLSVQCASSRISTPGPWKSTMTSIMAPMSRTSTRSPRTIRSSAPRAVTDVLGNLNAPERRHQTPCATISAATPTTPCSGRSWDRRRQAGRRRAGRDRPRSRRHGKIPERF